MKKIILICLTSLLLLGACGQSNQGKPITPEYIAGALVWYEQNCGQIKPSYNLSIDKLVSESNGAIFNNPDFKKGYNIKSCTTIKQIFGKAIYGV